MKYNTCMEFDLQDYHFLKSTTDAIQAKLDKVETKITQTFPEKSTGRSIVLEANVPMIATVMAFGTPSTPTYSFTVSGTNSPTVNRKTTNNPSHAEPISMFHIVWNGLHGQIDWNGCYWLIERNEQPGNITLTFPNEYEYRISINYNI